MRTPRIPSRRNDRGATAVEYALVVALIAVVIVASVVLLGGNLRNAYASVGSSLSGTTVSAQGPATTPVPTASRPSATGASDPCSADSDLRGGGGNDPSCTINRPASFDGVAFVYTVNGTCSGDCGNDNDEARFSGSTITVGSSWNNDSATFQWCYSYAGSATYAAIPNTCFSVNVT
jgi:pilus assembly protein Flp/PilA